MPLPEVADEPVADPAGVAGDDRAAGGDVHRDRGLRAVVDRRADRRVVRPVRADAVLGPQAAHQLDRLAHPGEALLELRPLTPGDGDLVQGLAGADAEHDPARVQQPIVANACAITAGL